MEAERILEHARTLGVTVEAIGNRLLYKPKDNAPAELVEELRQHKVEVLACLKAKSRETYLLDLPNPIGYGGLPKAQDDNTESSRLLVRLEAGSRWLAAQHQLWLADDPSAADDANFSEELAAWDSLERILRQVYHYQGCIFGPGQACPEDACAWCDPCAVATRPVTKPMIETVAGPVGARQLSLTLP